MRLAVDTGSTETLVMPEVTDTLGYNARAGEAITVIRTAIGKEQGYLLRVAKFSRWATTCRTSAYTSMTFRTASAWKDSSA